ncbi:hypothetical protein BH23PLA1_BH23PLA1_09470 [soil metagenome]
MDSPSISNAPSNAQPTPTLNPAPTVAVIRSENRRGAVAEALALIAEEVRAKIAPGAILLPTVGPRESTSTSAGVLSAVLDVLLALDPGEDRQELTVASAAPRVFAGYRRLGYLKECQGRPVRFLDLERDAGVVVSGEDPMARGRRRGPWLLCRSVISKASRVSIAPFGAVAGSLDRHLRSALHPSGRQDLSRLAERSRLLRLCLPGLSLIEGPTGWSRRRVLAVSGTDPLAVEAVAATILGRQDRLSASLPAAEAAGLGIADLDRINLVGDPISTPGRSASRHPGDGLRVDPGQPGSVRRSGSVAEARSEAARGGSS